ncbi:hypothetical protein [Acidicapsa acidisoli]|uniref:hypothetical protein n=1 Tax=Acidicapsa acidisoli TaxID=1615681 RepID=UPI0021DFFF8C|nr:hypothetical protein [Acidicapsa acidisoli]
MATTLQFGNELTVENPRESSAARTLAKFYFATFWAIIFTGAVRKWLFPGVSILYLLQDVPISLAYIYAIWVGLFDRGYLLLGMILVSAVLILQGLLQIIIVGLPIFVATVGIHNYLFYLPMLIVFPICLTEKYRRIFIWSNLLLSIPMCALAIAQAESSTSAWINKTSEGDAFGLPGADIARVSGTFNFTVFYGIWVSIAVAFCMGEWLLPKERRTIGNRWLLIACTFAANLCHLVSGSRSAIALAGAAILGGLVCAIVLGSTRAILAIGGICILMPAAAAMTYVISPSEFNIVLERFTGASYVENSKGRLTDGLIGFATIPQFSLIGAGIGLGVDASHLGDSNTYNYTYDLSEGDTIRNVMELGTPVGFFYIMIRFGFLLAMVVVAVRIVRGGTSPHVLPLSFCLLAQAYQGDLTRNATMTSSQVMMGYAFILGAFYYPDNTSSQEFEAGDLLTRSV